MHMRPPQESAKITEFAISDYIRGSCGGPEMSGEDFKEVVKFCYDNFYDLLYFPMKIYEKL